MSDHHHHEPDRWKHDGVRVIKGDRVRVQLMANDPHRGRVVEKL